jgi:leader peptidase (prepilin peptidase)/N-methyltransferase
VPILVEDVSPFVLRTIAFVFGALWGSFFNVAIYRWPRDMSVVKPGSHCPSCSAPIPGYLNIPILGYVLLRGRTACCKTPLSPRYPLIELLSAVLCVAIAELFVIGTPAETELVQASLHALCYFAFVGGLVIVTFVDLDEWIIPDEVSLPGTALGLATAGFREMASGGLTTVEDCALGAGIAFLITQLPFVWGYELLTGRRGLGEGDPKLLMMIGAFVGTQGVLFCLIAGPLQGLLFAAFALASGRGLRQPEPDSAASEPTHESEPRIGKLKMPFGPILSLAAIEYLFFGQQLVAQWIRLFMPDA